MKLKLFLFFIFSILIGLVFLQCPAQGSSGGGGGSGGDDDISGNEKSDPFTGILYREMVLITGGTFIQTDGINSFNHTISNFVIGKYEVTYELWYKVYIWAAANGYTISTIGLEGSNGTGGASPTPGNHEPVTNISWRDAIVWCNAYSQMSGLTPSYTYLSAVIKDSRDSNATACDNAICKWSVGGYRLLTEGEWHYVASNKGATPHTYLSGAIADYKNDAACFTVAVFGNYSSSGLSTGIIKTANVGTKTANQFSINDMSGNVSEWCWDWRGSYPGTAQTDYRGLASGSERIARGGNWVDFTYYCRVGYRNYNFPNDKVINFGFRVARSN